MTNQSIEPRSLDSSTGELNYLANQHARERDQVCPLKLCQNSVVLKTSSGTQKKVARWFMVLRKCFLGSLHRE